MRLFVALPLDEAGIRDLVRYRQTLERLGVRGNFTRPENLHITLAFLGEQPEWTTAAEALDTVEAVPGLLRLELPKAASRGFAPGQTLTVHIAPEDILLLTGGDAP